MTRSSAASQSMNAVTTNPRLRRLSGLCVHKEIASPLAHARHHARPVSFGTTLGRRAAWSTTNASPTLTAAAPMPPGTSVQAPAPLASHHVGLFIFPWGTRPCSFVPFAPADDVILHPCSRCCRYGAVGYPCQPELAAWELLVQVQARVYRRRQDVCRVPRVLLRPQRFPQRYVVHNDHDARRTMRDSCYRDA